MGNHCNFLSNLSKTDTRMGRLKINPNLNMDSAISIWQPGEWVFPFIKGRVALYALLKAAGVGPGDEILIPGFTCVVVPAAVQYSGAQPVFYDIDPATLNGCPISAAALIGPKTKVLILQHTFGMPADPGDLRKICRQRNIVLVEDCAHAIGACWESTPVGTLGDAAFCSFQWSKPVTTGLGGLARVNSSDLNEKLADVFDRDFKEPGLAGSLTLAFLSGLYNKFFRPSLYWVARDSYQKLARMHLVQGSSSEEELNDPRMPDKYCQKFGKIRLHQINKVLGEMISVIEHRRKIARIYIERLATWGAFMQTGPENADPTYLRFPVLVENREDILTQARLRRIELGDWFNAPLHPAVAQPSVFGYELGMCPHAERTAERIINLPTHKHVSARDAEIVLSFLEERRTQIAREPA